MKNEKIVLGFLPFWTPLIPPQGIASLKSFLQEYGYTVTTVDAASENIFLELYERYFDVLRTSIPISHRGNFYNIGHDVLRNHMMAYTNIKEKNEYIELVKILVFNTYYYQVEESQIFKLIEIIETLFKRLQEYFLRLLAAEKPAVLGLSANSGNLGAVNFIFRLTRKHYPHIKNVMGGCVFFNHLAIGNPDLEFFLERTRHYIDKIIMGKGEVLFLKLLQGELPESQRVFTWKDINEETLRSYSFGIPDLSDYALDRYFYLAVAGSSGCMNQCSFCNTLTFFGEFKKKEAAQTVQQIMELQKRHGHRLFFMTDALLNPVITDIAHEIIQADITAYLDGYFSVDEACQDMENTLLWRRGGFYRARLGCESGSQQVLDLMGKKITPGLIRTAVSNLAQAGIKTTTYWVIGHPGETEADFQQTLDLVEELKNYIWQAECNPFTYFYVGQTHSREWGNKRRLLYPGTARDLLMTQTWVLDCEPSREVIYDRVFRFVQHCNQLGIPNPYTLSRIYQADQRWKKLHKNAVPALIDIVNNEKNIEKESRKVKKILYIPETQQDEGDFAF